MKISHIPQVARNVRRTAEVFGVLGRYGLADWINRLDLDFAKEFLKDRAGEAIARLTTEVRVRLALTELGPTAIKLGQILSTRADLVGIELAHELQGLQDSTPADPAESVRSTIEAELGKPISELFSTFSDEPLASASIGQVHAAKLVSGEDVVVKVRHANIEETVAVDLDILGALAMLAERFPEFRNYRPSGTVAEFRRTLLRELDFTREARHMELFEAALGKDPTVHVPRAYSHLCTPRVLVMERVHGIPFNDPVALRARGVDCAAVARRGAEVFLEMIFVHGLYHADPHPGNLVVMPGDVIGLLDFGMVGRVDEKLREGLEEMLLALANRDAAHLTSVITRVGATPYDLDQAALSLDVADYISHYATQKLDEFDLSGALTEMIEIIRRYGITLPARLAMLIKVLVVLEGTGRLISPRFSLTELIEPYRSQMLLRRLSPKRHWKKLSRVYSDLEHLAEVLPRSVIDILQQVQSGRFDVHLDHRGLEPSVNRLVLGLLTSALFMGSSMMLSSKVAPLINLPWGLAQDLSVLGLLGASVSIGMGLRLMWAITKSGHLDRRK